MREDVRGGRIRQIVSGDVDRLHGGDRTARRARNALLEFGEFAGQRRLVADARGEPTHQARHLGTRLNETEDVIDE